MEGRFTHYEQTQKMSCGLACLRTLARWLEKPHASEEQVGDILGAGSVQDGLDSKKMRKALRLLLHNEQAPKRRSPRPIQGAKLHEPPMAAPNVVHLLLTASYPYPIRGTKYPTNPGHWIIVRGLVDVRKSLTGEDKEASPRGGARDHLIGLVLDPHNKTRPYFQSWLSLLAMPTLTRFDVTLPESLRF